MTTTLNLRLVKYLSGATTPSGAVAQVIAYDERGARRRGHDRRDVIVPAGYDAEARQIEVAPGRYVVEAVLPSGEFASAEVDVGAGGSVDVDLRPVESPREWLSWQQYLGNVPQQPVVETSDERLLRETAGPPRLHWIDTPAPALAGPGGGEAWPAIARALDSDDPLSALGVALPGPAQPVVGDAEWQIFRLGSGGPLGWTADDPAPSGPTPRRYVVVRSPAFTEMAVAPVPWERSTGGPVAIDTLVSNVPRPGAAAIAMSPLDPDVGPALGYMGSGALGPARQLFDTAIDLLFGKTINPLAAAAGGYVLLATDHSARAHWHSWIRNLGQWFDWLPDGAIQHGRLLLRHRQSKDDVAAAREAFFAAYRRGIPFYSLGLQWLVEGLRQLAPRDDEAREMLAHVQEVTWRANLQQPFTTLRLIDAASAHVA